MAMEKANNARLYAVHLQPVTNFNPQSPLLLTAQFYLWEADLPFPQPGQASVRIAASTISVLKIEVLNRGIKERGLTKVLPRSYRGHNEVLKTEQQLGPRGVQLSNAIRLFVEDALIVP